MVSAESGTVAKLEQRADGAIEIAILYTRTSQSVHYVVEECAIGMRLRSALLGERPWQTCETCGVDFRPTGYQSRYCSVRCRNTGQKRNRRAREQQKVSA